MKTRLRLTGLILLIAGIAIPGFFALRHIGTWPTRVHYPGELDNAESTVLAELIHLRNGVPIYAAASVGRFDSVLYGPFFYLLCSRIVDPHAPDYTHLRELSLLATVGLALACGLLAFWVGRNLLAALVAPLLFLSYSFVTHFGTQSRCDSLALLLGFSGFLAAYRFRDSNKILLAIPLLTLGFYYKQQFIGGPLAIILFLILDKRLRLAAQFVALLGIAVLTLSAVFQFAVFRHQAFSTHLLTYNIVPFSWPQGLSWAFILIVTFVAPGALALQFLRRAPNLLLSCYMGWLGVLTPLMMAKRSANLNYAIELALMLSALVAAQVSGSFSTNSRALLCAFLLAMTVAFGNLYPVWVPQEKDLARDRAVQAFLAAHFPRGSSALGQYVGDPVRAEMDVPISDFNQYAWLVCKGTLSDQILLSPLRERHFAIILLRFDLQAEKDRAEPGGGCLPRRFSQAIIENYEPVDGSAEKVFAAKHYYAWIPRP